MEIRLGSTFINMVDIESPDIGDRRIRTRAAEQRSGIRRRLAPNERIRAGYSQSHNPVASNAARRPRTPVDGASVNKGRAL
jgi:hypothetical protein